MFKSLLRGNATPMKYKMQIEPLQLQYPASQDLAGPVFLLWEKSPRIARSRPVQGSGGICKWNAGESFQMVLTMYRKKGSADFLPKETSLKARVTTPKGEKTLGTMTLNMAEFCDARTRRFELSLQLDSCVLKCVLTTELVPMGATDDSVSTISGISSADARPSMTESYADGFGRGGSPDSEPDSAKNIFAKHKSDVADHASLEGFDELDKFNDSDDIPAPESFMTKPAPPGAKRPAAPPSGPSPSTASTDDMKKLRAELAKAKFDLQEKEILIRKKQTEIGQLKDEATKISSAEKSLAEANQRNQTEREKALSIVENFREEKRKQIEGLSASLAERDSQLSTLRVEADSLTKRVASLEREVESQKKDLEVERKQLAERRAEVTTLREAEAERTVALESALAQLAAREAREARSATGDGNLRRELDEYESSLAERDEKLSRAARELAREKDRAAQLEAENGRRRDAEARWAGRAGQLQVEVESLEARLLENTRVCDKERERANVAEKARERADRSDKESQKLAKEATEAYEKARVARTVAEKEARQAETEAATEKANLQASVARLEQSLLEVRSALALAEDRLKMSGLAEKASEQKLRARTEAAEKARLELEELLRAEAEARRLAESESFQRSETIVKLERLLAEANARLTRAEAALDAAKVEKATAEASRAEVDRELRISMDRTRELSQSLSEREEELRIAGTEAGKSRAEIEGLIKKVELLSAKTQEGASSAQQWARERADLLAERDRARSEIKTIQTSLSQEREVVTSARSTIANLERQLSAAATASSEASRIAGEEAESRRLALEREREDAAQALANAMEATRAERERAESIEKQYKQETMKVEKANRALERANLTITEIEASRAALESRSESSAQSAQVAAQAALKERESEKAAAHAAALAAAALEASLREALRDSETSHSVTRATAAAEASRASDAATAYEDRIEELLAQLAAARAEAESLAATAASANAAAALARRAGSEAERVASLRADEAASRADEAERRCRRAEQDSEHAARAVAAAQKEAELLRREAEILRSSPTPKSGGAKAATVELESARDEALRELEIARMQLSELRRDLSDARREAEENLEASKNATREASRLREESERLEKTLQKETIRISTLETTLSESSESSTTISSLKASLEKESNDAKQARENEAKLADEIEDLRRDLALARVAIENEVSSSAAISAQADVTRKDFESLKAQMSQLREESEARAAEAARAAASTSSAAAAAATATAQRERADAVSRYEKIRSRHAELREQYESTRAELERVEELLSQTSKQLSAIEEKCATVEKNYTEERARWLDAAKNRDETLARLSVENTQLRERRVTFEAIQAAAVAPPAPSSGGWLRSSKSPSTSASAVSEEVINRLKFYEQQLMEADETLLAAKQSWSSSTVVLRERNEMLEARLAEVLRERAEDQESRGEEGLELARIRQKLNKSEKRCEKLSELMNRFECQLVERKVELTHALAAKDEAEASLRVLNEKFGVEKYHHTEKHSVNEMDSNIERKMDEVFSLQMENEEYSEDGDEELDSQDEIELF